jgi:hypothetical protein
MKKVLFLDMDGVLNCHHSKPEVKGEKWVIDRKLVNRLNVVFEVCKDVAVVLSSTWKEAVKDGTIDINEKLVAAGYTGPKIVEMTPYLCELDGWQRGREIKQWLEKHPEVEKFVILDDEDDMLDLKSHLVQTDYWSEEGGVTATDVQKIVEVLF